MKSISTAAMAAIEAGEAIVTGAVEIVPVTRTSVGSTAALCFVLDRSGSMAGERLTTMKSAMATVLGNVSAAVSGGAILDLAAVSFSDGTSTITRRRASTAGVNQVNSFVQALTASGGTDFADAMTAAKAFFSATPPSVTQRFLFFITDGIPNSGTAATAAATLATMAGVQSYGINIVLEDTSFTALVDNTASDGVPVVSGSDPSGLVDAVANGLEEGGGLPAEPPTITRVWGGHGPLTIAGEVYQGIGERGLAQQNSGAIGGVAQGMVLSLSGIAPELIALVDADEVKGASVVLRRLIFAGDGKTLLDSSVFDRGRVDACSTDESIGGTATIVLNVESAARGLGRSGARQRSDSDQRLINAADGYFKNTSYAGEKSLYWGGRRPARAGGAVSGGDGGSSTFNPTRVVQ